MVLSLAGRSVSDVTPAALDAMRQAVAAQAGTPVAAVTASVAAGSVLLTFRIALQTEGEADAAAVALAEHMGDAGAASTWLGAASGIAMTVTDVITLPTKLAIQPPAPPPPLSPSPPQAWAAVARWRWQQPSRAHHRPHCWWAATIPAIHHGRTR